MQTRAHHKNVTFTKSSISSKWSKCKSDKNMKMIKCEMMKKLSLPLRIWTPDFGLRIGSRGTPWNSKSAGPGGSDFAKCQKVPFIWHFGHFGVFDIFDVFSLFLISVLSLFDDFDFVDFITFLIFSILMIFTFIIFCQFLSLFSVWDEFWSIFVSVLGASMMTHFSPSISALPLSPLLVVKLWPILSPHFDVNFWSILVIFLSYLSDFD